MARRRFFFYVDRVLDFAYELSDFSVRRIGFTAFFTNEIRPCCHSDKAS